MQLSPDLRTEIVLASILPANLINWLLHGVLTVQLYLYYLAFPNDRTWIKVAVYAVYIIETIQVIGLGIVQVLMITGDRPFVLPPLFYSYWIFADYRWTAQVLLTEVASGLVSLISQCIYAYRIRIITRRKVMPRLIIALATLQLFTGLLLSTVHTKVSALIVVASWSGLNAINDMIIAFIMVRSLSKEKSLSVYTRSRVIRLVRLIIATGSLTVAANVLLFILVFVDAYVVNGWIGTAIGIIMPKLYANSILVMLNDRMTIRNPQDLTPLNMISTNAFSTLVIANHRTESCNSATPCDEVTFSDSSTRSPILHKNYCTS